MKTLIKKLLREGLIKESMIKTPLYHGTKYNFDKFDLKFFNAGSGDGGWLGRGIYLTNDYEYAESYGNVLECKVNIKNPYIVTDFIYSRSPEKLANDLGVNNAWQITSKLIKEGYDSVILTYPDKGYTKDGEYDKFIEICVFDPNNIEPINRINESSKSISKNQLFDLEDEILNKIPNNCLYHGSNDISWFNTVKDIDTLTNTANAKSKYLFLTPNKYTALNYSIITNGMNVNIGDKSGILSFELTKSKGIKLKSENLKYNSMSEFENILDKYKDKGYDYVIIEPDGNNYVILNPNIIKLISKNYTLDVIGKINEGEIVYHGSPSNFGKFKLKQGSMFDTKGTAPIFLTTDKDNFAKYYAKENGCIYTIELDDNIKLFDFRKMVDWWELKPNDYGYKLYDDMNSGKYDLTPYNDDIDKLYDYMQSGEYSILERKWFFDWLKDNKYDGAYVVETRTLNLFVFSPNKFKILNKECN